MTNQTKPAAAGSCCGWFVYQSFPLRGEGGTAKPCPQGAITVDNFLARIDWDKCTACGECAKVCPTGAMVSGDFSGASRVQPYKSRNA